MGLEIRGREEGSLQLVAAHAVADADERAGHLGAEVVCHVKEVAGVIDPGGCNSSTRETGDGDMVVA